MASVDLQAADEAEIRGCMLLGAALGAVALGTAAALSAPRPLAGLAAGAVVGVIVGSRVGIHAWAVAARARARRGV